MSFRGVKIQSLNKTAIKSLNGFYGVKINLDVVAIRVTDHRGRGLANTSLTATNPISGTPFQGITDSNGSIFMQLDSQTEILITKDSVHKVVSYNNETSPTYTIDFPYIE